MHTWEVRLHLLSTPMEYARNSRTRDWGAIFDHDAVVLVDFSGDRRDICIWIVVEAALDVDAVLEARVLTWQLVDEAYYVRTRLIEWSARELEAA